MALISRVGRIRLTNTATGGYREWLYTFANASVAAGEQNLVTVTPGAGDTSGVSPPAAATSMVRQVRPSDSSASIREFTTFISSGAVSDDFWATVDGSSGASARAGMVYGYFRVERRDPVSNALVYDINNYDTSGTVPAGHTVERDVGYAVVTTTGVLYFTNSNPGGIANEVPAASEPAEFGESLWGRVQLAHPAWTTAVTVTHRLEQPAGNIVITGVTTLLDAASGRYERGFGSVVDDRWQRADAAVHYTILFPNATINGVSTGQPWLTLSNAPAASMRADPRFDVDTLFMIDESAWFTPPLSSPTHNANYRRQTLEQAFIGHRFRKRRTGGGVVDASMRFTRSITPIKPGSPLSEADVPVQTQGGQEGWSSSLMVWGSQHGLPGGQWDQAITITAPATMNAPGMIATVLPPVFLVARNSNYQPQAILGNTGARGRHLQPGDTILIGMRVKDTANGRFIVADSDAVGPQAYCTVERVNATATGTEYLDANMAWQPAQDGAGAPFTVYEHRVPAIVDGTYRMVIPGNVTALWDETDLIITLRMIIGGAPYTLYAAREVTGKFQTHDLPSNQWLGIP